MEKIIPYEKLSKKQRRAIDQKKRNTWNGLNPVTRKPENPKAYKRRQTKDWEEPETDVCFYFSERDVNYL